MLGVFLDLEATGLDPLKHVPIEIALLLIDLRTGELRASFDTHIQCSQTEWGQASHESQQVHRLSWDDVAHAPSRAQVGDQLLSLFKAHHVRRGRAIFIGQNPSFDRAYMAQLIPVCRQEERGLPYHWLDLASMFWAYAQGPHRLQNPYPFYGLSKDQIAAALGMPPETSPHRAGNGVRHLVDCYARLVGWPAKPEVGSGALGSSTD